MGVGVAAVSTGVFVASAGVMVGAEEVGVALGVAVGSGSSSPAASDPIPGSPGVGLATGAAGLASKAMASALVRLLGATVGRKSPGKARVGWNAARNGNFCTSRN